MTFPFLGTYKGWLLAIVFMLVLGGETLRQAYAIPEESSLQTMMGADLKRQTIYDRNGAVMATSILTASAYLNPLTVPSHTEWMGQVEKILSLPEGFIKERLIRANGLFSLKEELSEEEIEDLLALGLDCVEIYKKYKRIYPSHPIAKPILGTVNDEGVASGGVEYFFDSQLKQPIYDDEEGNGLYLSIDLALQKRAEKELEWQMYRCRAQHGAFIISRLSDGEIVALATSYVKNSKKRADSMQEIFALYPKAKPSLLLPFFDMLEKAKYQTEASNKKDKTSIKKAQTNKRSARRWRWVKTDKNFYIWGPWSKKELEQVANPNHFLPYLGASGLGTITNIELPNENTGSLPTHILSKWMLGDEVAATPLQILRAFNAIVTKGAFSDFHIVKTDETDDFSSVNFPDISEKEIDYVLNTISKAKGPVSAMVVKTKLRPTRYQAMALGFWPRDNPEVSYILVVDDAKWNPRMAKGNLGTPKQVAQLAVKLLQQPEIFNAVATVSTKKEKNKKESSSSMPNLVGLSLRNAMETMLNKGIRVQIEGSGHVVRQEPRAGASLPKNGICKLIGVES